MSEAIVLATAGHVDHGKTSLVQALTGRDTDRLAEEKARGISIELGFAPLRLASGRQASLIDVPGHERFVRHMVAGVTGVDGFVLCVAADDGVMPQTREHLAVLDLLGIRHGVVAITRSDLADPGRAAAEVAPLVADGTDVVPVCAPAGEGIARLRRALDGLASRLGAGPHDGPTRLWIDRSFSVAGAGTVVTGTLWGEAGVGVGDPVTVLPAGAAARVRGVQVHDVPVARAGAGRVALALAGVGRGEAARGSCVVGADDGWAPTDRLGVGLVALPGEEAAIRSGAVLQCFLGTHEGPAVCVLLDRGRLEPGDRCLAELRLPTAVCARPADRLVLRSSTHRTVAGAQVIDAHPPPGRSRRERAERLAVMAAGDAAAILEMRARESGAEGVEIGEGTVTDAVVAIGRRAFHRDVLRRARADALAAVVSRGGTMAAARAATGLPPPAAAATIDALIRDGEVVERGARLLSAGADAGAPAEVEAVGLLLAAAGLAAPTSRRLAELSGLPDDVLTTALAALQEAGHARRVGELWFDTGALDRAWGSARPLLEAGPVGIAELRDAWGVGRRHALAIAGHLDARGLTRREGDRRALRRAGRGA